VFADVKGGAKAITYIGSVVYMCASSSDGATSFEFFDYQAMAEDSRPSVWSKRRPGVVGTSRVFRVGYTRSYERYSESVQFHRSCWAVLLAGTPIVI
jgi:hypothetical protein